MHRSRLRTLFAAGLLVTNVFVFTPTIDASRSTAGVRARATAESTPVALVKTILVGGQPVDRAKRDQVLVLRASGERRPGKAGQTLFANDEVRTFPGTQVTILFLDTPSEKENQLTLDPDSWIKVVAIDSAFLRLGRIFGAVQGLFSVVLRRYKLGVSGTQFEVTAADDPSESNRAGFKVIDGMVDIEEGDFSLLGASVEAPREFRFRTTQAALSDLARFPHLASLTGAAPLGFLPVFGEQGRRAPARRRTRIGRLEEATFAGGTLVNKQPSTIDSVRAVVDWTNDVIVASQPSYPAKRIIPHYASPEDRAIRFRRVRFDAIWNANARALGVLGNIHIDWGNGAKALEAYRKEGRAGSESRATANSLADLAEAYRLSGRLDEASAVLARALAVEPESAVALNARGNLHSDWASAAHEEAGAALKKEGQDKAEELSRTARALLDRARQDYEKSLSAPSPADVPPQSRRGSLTRKVVITSNLGEVYLGYGDVSQQLGRPREARQEYQQAEERFNAARATLTGDEPRYPFMTTGLGEAYRRLARVERSQGNAGRADDYSSRAEAQNKEAIQTNPDLSDAYMNLGRVYEERGPDYWQSAKENYKRAIELRPAAPEPRFRIGSLQQQEIQRGVPQSPDDESLNDNFKVYLKLEPDAFKQGEKARIAEPFAVSTSNSSSRVPSLVGKTQQSAIQLITESKLRTGSISYRADRARAGTVIQQSIEPGRPVAPGTAIDLAIAGTESGPSLAERARVPDLVGRDIESAWSEVDRAGLNRGTVSEQESSKPVGTVIKQNPKPRSEAALQTRVDIVIARARPIKVPNVIGRTRQNAVKEITGRGLVVGSVSEQADCTKLGKVIEQDPLKDAQVAAGSTVDIVVGGPGENSTTVPKVTNLSQHLAEDLITQHGLRIGRIKTEVSDKLAGTVLRTEPAVGTPLPKECSVELVVAVWVEVPRFIGLSETDALDRLGRGFLGGLADLRRGSVTYRTSREYAVGTVVDQSPRQGSLVPKGTEVSLVIARPSQLDDTGDTDRHRDDLWVIVPRVEGMSVSDAEGVLERAGLVAQRVGAGNSVRSVSPGAGTRVRRGTSVRLFLMPVDGSGGSRRSDDQDYVYVDVPNVTGIPCARARQQIERSGLKSQQHGGDRNGSVLRQEPPAGRARVKRDWDRTVHIYCGVG